MFWGAIKIFKFFEKYCSVRTKKLHKMKLKNFFLILEKTIMIFKLELSPQNFHYDVLYPLYSGHIQTNVEVTVKKTVNQLYLEQQFKCQ